MKFEALEKHIEEKRKTAETVAALVEKEQAALEAYHSKKHEYEQTLTESALSGKDATEELDQLDAEITQAKATYERRKKEREIVSLSRPGESISSDDVVRFFNTDFIPDFKSKKYDPALKDVLKAKFAYVHALKNFESVVAEFERTRSEARGELSHHYFYKLNGLDFASRQERYRYFITDEDLLDLSVNREPKSLQYIEEEEI
ncbi:MAG: hypothetical protein ACE3JK_01495 [Sporolactobacillus sp.]